MTDHYSDCATNNAPAMEPGECDCGGYPLTWFHMPQAAYEWQRHIYRAMMGLPQRTIYRNKVRPRGQGETNRNSDVDDIEQLWEVL